MKTPRLPVEWWILRLQSEEGGAYWSWWTFLDAKTERAALREFQEAFGHYAPGTYRLVKVACVEVARSKGEVRR